MPETKHSPEPWSAGDPSRLDYDMYDANGRRLTLLDDIAPADLRRIVACVNFCAGISTEELERLGSLP